jgi:putative endonuclease
MASERMGTLYTGVTSDLPKRGYEHRHGLVAGFTRRYGCKLLVWYQYPYDLEEARRRELQIKAWRRAWKIELIETENPDWDALYDLIASP